MPWLASILAPLSEEEFFERHHGRRSCFARGAQADRFASLLSRAELLAGTALREIDAADRGAMGEQIQREIDASAIADEYTRGRTICADASACAGVAPMLATMRAALGIAGAPFAKVYASPPGAGFALHADAHDVFVLQIEGRKRWRFSSEPGLASPPAAMKVVEGRVVHVHPREGERVPIAVPEPDALEERILEPGDALYLPAGAWHETSAIDHALALSVSPPLGRASDVVLSLASALLVGPEWRAPIAGPEAARDLDARLESLTKALASTDRRTLVRAWCAQASADDPRAPIVPRTRPVAQEDRLRRTAEGPLLHCVAPDENGRDVVFFYAGGEELSFPIEALPFVRELARRRELVARNLLAWDPRLTWDSAREALEALIDAGVLAPID